MEFEKKDINRTDMEEDQNTSYFHKQCRISLSKNHIFEITTSDGILLKGQDQMNLAAESHYQLLFKEDKEGNEDASTDFLSHIPSLVNKDDNTALSKQFTEEEICNIIWAMEPDKAPRLDNFLIHFYR